MKPNLRAPGRRSGGGRAVGLDVGATSVRAAALSLGTAGGVPSARLDRAAALPLPPGVMVKGTVEQPGVLTETLKRLWREQQFGTADVVLGVANPQVVVRDLRVPPMDPATRARALPFLAKDVVALPIEEVVLDFIPLGPADDGSVAGLLVATPKLPVLTLVNAVEASGVRVAKVDLSSFAVLRAVAQEQLAAEAVVDVGAELTTIVIHAGGVPRLVRTLARGGNELTQRLAERLGVPPGEAEAIKRAEGVTGGTGTAALTVREMVRPLVAEIRSSVNYFRSGNGGAPIDQLALTGGGADLPGLEQLLADQVGAPTVRTGPTQHLDAGPADVEGQPSVVTSLSVGLALGVAA